MSRLRQGKYPKTIFNQEIEQSQEIQARMRKHNSQMRQKRKHEVNVTRIPKSVKFHIPNFEPPVIEFGDTFMCVPRPPRQTVKPKFPLFQKMFNFIYYLVGEPGKGIWNKFIQSYQQQMPTKNQCIPNLSTIDNLSNLNDFIKSGMQIRLLVENLSPTNRKIQQLLDIINENEVIETKIQDQWDIFKYTKRPNKVKLVVSMQKEYDKEIKSLIKKSFKDKIHFNFINIESKYPQLFKRKNLIQACIQPKDMEEYLEQHRNFTQMMETYQNKNLEKQIEREINNDKSIHQIRKYTAKIEEIKRKQKQFCASFQKQLIQMNPIEDHPDREQIFFKIIQQYKMQLSIYEVLNNTIRLSICINESRIKWLSTLIKYMYESIRYFFLKQLSTMALTHAYRGALLPLQEIKDLKVGQYMFNIGFMSTSKNQRVAEGFKSSYETGDQKQMAYLIKIELGEHFKDPEYSQSQQGFFYLPDEFNNQNVKDDLPQDEILFNTLNIFKVKSIDKNKRVLQLFYAPHIVLMKKMKQGNITEEQKKQHDRILPNITSLNKSSYDRGQALRNRGKLKEAMEFYKEAEQRGQSLSIMQKLNKIEILSESKNYDLVGKVLDDMIKQEETIKQKQQKQLISIIRLTKQSENMQKTSDFMAAETSAKEATQTTEELVKQLKEKQEKKIKINNQEILAALLLQLKTLIELGKSRYETNYYEDSINAAYVGFRLADNIYQIFIENILPEIQISLKNQKIIDNGNSNSLLQVSQLELKNGQVTEISIQRIEAQKEEAKTIQKMRLDQKHRFILHYFNKRSVQKNVMKFYRASFEMQAYNCTTADLKRTKLLFNRHMPSLQTLIKYEMDLFDVMIKDLKAVNIDVLSCMKNLKQDFYDKRFQQFIAINQSQSSANSIKYKSRYAAFLLDYSNLEKSNLQESIEKKEMKIKAQEIIKELNTCIEKEVQEEKQSFTIEKTIVLETEANHYKSFCLDLDIIQKAATYHITHRAQKQKQSNPNVLRTLSNCRNKQSYIALKQRLSALQKIHEESNESINKFHYVLKDIIDQVSAMNEAYGASDFWHDELIEGSKKLQYFNTNYLVESLNSSINQKNQYLAQLYFLTAQNKLRRGFYRQAQKGLIKAQKLLDDIYGKQLNTLCARHISIKCIRLQAQLIGMYGNEHKKIKSLEKFMEVKAFMDRKISNKNTLALINQAVAFIAIRRLPYEISEVYQDSSQRRKNQMNRELRNICTEAQESLQRVIELRQSTLGKQNQFIAIAYSYLVSLQANIKPMPQQIHRNFEQGLEIFQNLMVDIKNEPVLLIYYMKMLSNYEKAKDKNNIQKIAGIYKKNAQDFLNEKKNIRGVFLAEQLLQAGTYLLQNKKYPSSSHAFLKKAQKDLYVINNLNSMDKWQNKFMLILKYKVYASLKKIYKEYQNKKLYKIYSSHLRAIKNLLKDQAPVLRFQEKNEESFLTAIGRYFGKCMGDTQVPQT